MRVIVNTMHMQAHEPSIAGTAADLQRKGAGFLCISCDHKKVGPLNLPISRTVAVPVSRMMPQPVVEQVITAPTRLSRPCCTPAELRILLACLGMTIAPSIPRCADIIKAADSRVLVSRCQPYAAEEEPA